METSPSQSRARTDGRGALDLPFPIATLPEGGQSILAMSLLTSTTTGGNGVSDRFRQSVYRAEDQWSSVVDRGGAVDFFGSMVQVPTQIRFGNLDDVRTYVEHVCTVHEVVIPDVRHRKGGSRAHYGAGIIAIPSGYPWAMRESVVLHEIAHHICVQDHASIDHDAHFTTIMLMLVESRLGPEAALLLRTGYLNAGAPI